MNDLEKLIAEKKTSDKKQRFINIIVIIIALVMIFTISFLINNLVKEKNKSAALVQALEQQQKLTDSLLILTRRLNSNSPDDVKKLFSIVKRLDKSATLVTYGYSKQEHLKLQRFVEEKGFLLAESIMVPANHPRPTWVSTSSTVFYYDKQNIKLAQDLADALKTLTGVQFTIKVGAGYLVSDADKQTTVIVHYIKQ